MDAKALAKSKRAHSQHLNKKHHRNPSSKAPSASPSGTDDPKKPPWKQLPEKAHQFRGSKPLPSNWDRYEEEYDSVLDDPSVKNTIQTVDAVPKSKGADYGYLISEAESRSTSNIQLDSSPLFDDVLTDFYQGYGSLLSAKGQGIQQRLEDENFVVEDEATTSNEASFLSLDLHLLAEQLGKIELARRLFIEPEMLPPELCTDQSQIRFSESEAAASGSEGVKINSTRQVTVHPGLGDSLDDLLEETSNSILEGIASVQLDPTQPLRTRPDMPKPTSVSLDDLFEETSSSYIIEGAASVQLDPSETLRNSSVLSKQSVVVAANLDDDLDDLLNETSRIQKSGLSREVITLLILPVAPIPLLSCTHIPSQQFISSKQPPPIVASIKTMSMHREELSGSLSSLQLHHLRQLTAIVAPNVAPASEPNRSSTHLLSQVTDSTITTRWMFPLTQPNRSSNAIQCPDSFVAVTEDGLLKSLAHLHESSSVDMPLPPNSFKGIRRKSLSLKRWLVIYSDDSAKVGRYRVTVNPLRKYLGVLFGRRTRIWL